MSDIGSNILKDGNSIEVKTGDWKNRRPIHLVDKCKHCMMCVPYCPEDCIIQKDNIMLGFDLDYCKGCGVCAKVCPFNAIEMKTEE
jgi:pyruvate ferredoxin oxidoreductase delta subunit